MIEILIEMGFDKSMIPQTLIDHWLRLDDGKSDDNVVRDNNITNVYMMQLS